MFIRGSNQGYLPVGVYLLELSVEGPTACVLFSGTFYLFGPEP